MPSTPNSIIGSSMKLRKWDRNDGEYCCLRLGGSDRSSAASSGDCQARAKRRRLRVLRYTRSGSSMKSHDLNKAGALVVFSGGQASKTCLAWALDRSAQVEKIGFD